MACTDIRDDTKISWKLVREFLSTNVQKPWNDMIVQQSQLNKKVCVFIC